MRNMMSIKTKKVIKMIIFAIAVLIFLVIIIYRKYYIFATYEHEDGGIVITGVKNWAKVPEKLVIPSTLFGKPVVGIGDSAFAYRIVKELVIKEGIEWIGDGAFESCGLKSIKLPDTLEEIGIEAFKRNYKLVSVKLPPSLRIINSGVFEDDSNLMNIEFSNTTNLDYIGKNVFNGTKWLELTKNEMDFFIVNDILVIVGDELSNSVRIPEGVKVLGVRTFCANTKVSEVFLPSSLERIYNLALSYMDLLTYIAIPDNVKIIESAALANNKNLKHVELSASLTELPDYLFSDCPSLTTVKLKEGIRVIESFAFEECISLPELKIPSTVTEIKRKAFYNCTSLDLEVPSTVTVIGEDAFYGVKHITYHGEATGAPWGALSMN